MPAPRSILIDIHDRGLNPQVAHKSVDSAGRIKVASAEAKAEPVPEPVKEKPAKASKKEEQENSKVEASGEATVDAVVSNEGAGSVEPSKQEEAVSETPAASPRRSKRTPASNA